MCVSVGHLVAFQWNSLILFFFCSLYHICSYVHSGFGQNCAKLQKLVMKMELWALQASFIWRSPKFSEYPAVQCFGTYCVTCSCVTRGLSQNSQTPVSDHESTTQGPGFSDRLCLNSPADQALQFWHHVTEATANMTSSYFLCIVIRLCFRQLMTTLPFPASMYMPYCHGVVSLSQALCNEWMFVCCGILRSNEPQTRVHNNARCSWIDRRLHTQWRSANWDTEAGNLNDKNKQKRQR